MTDTDSPLAPSAALIIIGNEILSGRTQDVNIQWLATKMVQNGIRLAEVRVVPDIEAEIVAAVNALRGKVSYLFTTGGIGPTHDDITTDAIAKALNLKIALNEKARQALLDYYGSEDKLNGARLKMARLPEGAELVANPVSGAPGFKVENVYVMAGVPRIMQAMLDNILPQLRKGPPILSATVNCGLPESKIAAGLEAIQDEFPEVEIGSYPHFRNGVLGLSLVLRSVDAGTLQAASQKVVELVESLGDKATLISAQPQ